MKKTVISLALALMLLFTFTFAASAQDAPAADNAIVRLDDMTEQEAPAVQGEAPAQLEAPDADEAPAEDAAALTKPDKTNTPYFIGAGLALLLFIGVAFYCKTNGNKPF